MLTVQPLLRRLTFALSCWITFVSGGVQAADLAGRLQDTRLINYYRGDAGWGYFWKNWDAQKMQHDLAKINRIGFNTVRIFVQPEALGYPVLSKDGQKKLAEFFALSSKAHLKVQLTLFDLWGNYDDLDGSRKWVDSVRLAIADLQQIAYIDLKNEVNVTNERTMHWLQVMLPYTQSTFRGVPVTFSMVIGVSRTIDSGLAMAIQAGLKPDLWDFHYYMAPEKIPEEIRRIRSQIGDAQVYFGEVGGSSYSVAQNTVGKGDCTANEQKQAAYLVEIQHSLRAQGLPFGGVWVYSDFARTAIPGNLGVSRKPTEYCFGMVSSTGHEKPVARAVHALFLKS